MTDLIKDRNSKLISLRHHLHQYPELSGVEHQTAQRIATILSDFSPTDIQTDVGGTGVMATYEYGAGGPTLLFRCELDALPIQEATDLPYKSIHDGISHKCGHDGHMTIIVGLAKWLNSQSFEKGRVILIFQPAEENGRGGKMMLEDPRIMKLKVDAAFALHNIPGSPMHEVIIPEDSFSPSVTSFSIKMTGKESHASEPEKGNNPALAIGQLIEAFDTLNRPIAEDPLFSLLTPVHINLGQKAYGISPGYGELHYTIRTWSEENMMAMKDKITSLVVDIIVKANLKYQMDWFEYFPAAQNNKSCNEQIERAAIKANLPIRKQKLPFRFGEDYGWFAQRFSASMFGLGAGVHTPPLHDDRYDFPDGLIETGVEVFSGIVEGYLGDCAGFDDRSKT